MALKNYEVDVCRIGYAVKESILQQKLNEANKHLDLILETLKFDLPLLLGLDKNLDKKINRILRTK